MLLNAYRRVSIVFRIIQIAEACFFRRPWIPFFARFGRAGSYLNIRCRWQRVCVTLAAFQPTPRALEVILRTCLAANFLIVIRQRETFAKRPSKQGIPFECVTLLHTIFNPRLYVKYIVRYVRPIFPPTTGTGY